MQLIRELWQSKLLIWDFAKNDFKTRYSGSMLGIAWAFIQPIMTILVFWFVFQVGFRTTNVQDVPFICWFAAGLVPWFFFSDSWANGGNVFIEYHYLIKKMVFKVSILPLIKVVSSLFIHAVFLVFLVSLFFVYGIKPGWIWIQLFYYSACMIVLVVGLTFITSSLTPFFKDMGNLVSVLLQFGMWMTPIMWSYTIIPEKYSLLLKLNPMYYIVEGYRDTLINQVWFWHRYNQTIWFWLVTLILFIVGATLFKKLKPHFADVL